MRLLNSDLRWYRDRLIALSACALVALMLAFGLLPLSASAHTDTVSVICDAQPPNVTVDVGSWTGHVRITRNSPPPKVTRSAYLGTNFTGKVVFTIADIGGNGSYTADRPEDKTGPPKTDPPPITFTVNCAKAQPGISTTKSAGGPIGTVISDSATVSGGSSPTGDVTFRLYDPSQTSCTGNPVFAETDALSGGHATSSGYTTAVVGIYRWTATYNGDANNLTATSGCQDEQVTVTPAAEQVAAAAAQQVQAAAVTLPKAGAGPQQQGISAPGGGGPFGASGIVATLLLALIGSVLFALRRREAEEPKA